MTNMRKYSFVTQMTYDVSDEEKNQAKQAVICINVAKNTLNNLINYLPKMSTPFKDDPNPNPDDIYNNRGVIRRFRDEFMQQVNDFKKQIFSCIRLLQIFSSDTQIIKIIKSLISSVEELDKKNKKFTDLYHDLKSKDFASNVSKSLEDVKKQCENVLNILDERLKTHIETNILSSNWVDSVGLELQVKIDKKTPLVQELSRQRQNTINNITKNK